MATFSGRGDGTGVKNPRLKSPFPDIEPRFGGAYFYVDADALYAFKSRGFGGVVGVVTADTFLLQVKTLQKLHSILFYGRNISNCDPLFSGIQSF